MWVEELAAYPIRVYENQDYDMAYNGKGYPQNIS
jgi:hypothetical protein